MSGRPLASEGPPMSRAPARREGGCGGGAAGAGGGSNTSRMKQIQAKQMQAAMDKAAERGAARAALAAASSQRSQRMLAMQGHGGAGREPEAGASVYEALGAGIPQPPAPTVGGSGANAAAGSRAAALRPVANSTLGPTLGRPRPR